MNTHDDLDSTTPPRRARWFSSSPVRLVLVALVAFGLGAVLFRSPAPDPHAGHGHDEAAAEDTIWTCSMHPQIRQSEPGQCPICGMDLIPVAPSGRGGDAPRDRVTLSPRAVQLARLETSLVARGTSATADQHLLGRVEVDETRLRSVSTWIGGRIDRLHLAATGDVVRAGQVVATLYSPDILAAHQDLLAARRQIERLVDASELAQSSASATLEALQERLRLLGLSAKQVEELALQTEPVRSQTIRSSVSGVVLERLATEGAWVMAGEALYRVADLSRVWVQLDAYERDLASLSTGQQVRLASDAVPGKTFEGRVAFIDPTLDPERRTARVRVEVANPAGELRPGVFVQAVVGGGIGERVSGTRDGIPDPESRVPSTESLTIPRSAVLLTGTRALVYVEVPNTESPTYEAREVVLGARAGELYPVLSGLAEGERVVTRGAFVLDADLQIRGGASLMTRDEAGGRGSGVAEEGMGNGEGVPSSESLGPVLTATLTLMSALASDDLAASTAAARQVVSAAGGLEDEASSAGWKEVLASVRGEAQRIAGADSLATARVPLEALAIAQIELVRRFGNPLEQTLHLASCPMATDRGEAWWLQAEDEVHNPFLGAAMSTCGDILETVPAGKRLVRPARGVPR